MWLKALATSTEVQFELEMYLRTQDAILRRNMSALYTDKLKSAHFSPINYLTIIPRARMGYESMAHEAEGRIGYRFRGHKGERNKCFSKIQLVGQKNIKTKRPLQVKARL